MEARVRGEVFRSIHKEGKKYYKTAITQSETETQTINVSTIKQYKPGDQIDLYCRISVSLFNGKAYLIIQEIDNQAENIMNKNKNLDPDPNAGEQSKRVAKI